MHLTKGRKMKKLLLIAVAFAAINAEATRARVSALANSPHLVDTQTVYTNPADIFALGSDYVTLETGLVSGTTATNGAEGMIVRSMNDAKWGLSLGHDSANASAWSLRGAAAAGGFNFSQQNPVEFTYGAKAGDISWAGTFVYSAYNNKTPGLVGNTIEKESSMGLRAGARAANWDASLGLGLTSTVDQADDDKYTGTPSISLAGGYQMDAWYLSGRIATAGFKTEIGGLEAQKYTNTSINVAATSEVKKDGSSFFYGAGLTNTTSSETVADTKTSSLSLPLWMGVEVDAASWLTLRGSATQTLQLVNNSKEETGGTTTSEFAPGANDTTVSAGVGLKFNKITVDGTLQATNSATSQELNGNSLLTMLGMTYWY